MRLPRSLRSLAMTYNHVNCELICRRAKYRELIFQIAKKWKSFIGEGYADSYLTTTRLWPVSNIRVWPVGLFAVTLVTWIALSPLLTA